MAQVEVAHIQGDRFRVEVSEGESRTLHEVAVKPDTLKRLGWKAGTEELVRRSFYFLLQREPKETILRSFELSAIAKYFPEYEQSVAGGLPKRFP